ncbi:hypothetical protein GGR50DRAFT_691342 [Xylaria sp. CBS 124048]|nr:hypothetical protein GGR50DRAFT_691342 [Xylaria sp. CBS 124048]
MDISSNCASIGCSQILPSHPPALAGNAVFLSLFALLIPITLALGVRYGSLGFVTAVTTGLALEVIGYVGRLLLHSNPDSAVGYAVFLAGTTLGPTCICGAIFLVMPRIVTVYGDGYRSWWPTWYQILLSALTAVSLILELTGSVVSAIQNIPLAVDTGALILVVGLAIQLLALAIFAIHGILFALALRTSQHDLGSGAVLIHNSRPFRIFLIAFAFATVLIILRTFYRIVLIAEGLRHSVTQSETALLVLDGGLMLIATVLLLICFPARALVPNRAAERLSQRPLIRPNRPLISRPMPSDRVNIASFNDVYSLRRGNHAVSSPGDMVNRDNLW